MEITHCFNCQGLNNGLLHSAGSELTGKANNNKLSVMLERVYLHVLASERAAAVINMQEINRQAMQWSLILRGSSWWYSMGVSVGDWDGEGDVGTYSQMDCSAAVSLLTHCLKEGSRKMFCQVPILLLLRGREGKPTGGWGLTANPGRTFPGKIPLCFT